MNLFKSIKSALITNNDDAMSKSKQESVKIIFSYLKSLVDPKLLPATFNKTTYPSERETIAYYRDFEAFVVGSKPPVVDREVDRQTLRLDISKKVTLSDLSPYFGLVFLPVSDQSQVLCKVVFESIKPTIREKFGQNLVRVLEASFEKQDVLGAFNEIRNSMGEKQALSIFQEMYTFVNAIYPLDLVKMFTDILPKEHFREEKAFILANEELKAKALEVEEKNKSLQDTQKAIANILEDEKKLEASLKAERDRFVAIVSSMGEGLFVLNENHKIDFINPVAEKLLGITANDVRGKDWSEVVTTFKGDREIPFSERSTVSSLKAGKVVITNLEDNHYYLTASGNKFPITSMTTPLLKDGKVIGAIKVFRDATQDKSSKEHIEEEVVKRTAQLSASINSLSLGFIMTNKDGVISLINSAAKTILRIENSLSNISALEKIISLKPSLSEQIKKSHDDDKLLEIKEVNYGNKVLHFYIAPVIATIGKNSEDIGTVILFEDITEQKIIDRSRDEFFSIASHELRTPLTAIRGNTSLIIDMYAKDFKDNELKEMVNDIHDSSVRLINIVNDFLNISRLEMGRMEFKKEKFDVVALAKDALSEIKEVAEEKKLELKLINSEQKGVEVLADPDRLKQVFINLMGNGINYTEKGSVTVAFEESAKSVKVMVADTGRGISPENQGLLFHKFQQAGSSLFTRDTTKGTGLGLYISKLMVEGMGGSIYLEKSEVNKGSVFSFTLPRN